MLNLSTSGMLAGTNGGGIFLFSDNGDSLGTFNESLTNLNVHTLAMDSLGYVYAGTDSGVFKILTPQTGVRQHDNNIPIGYKLEQNYPNPFNPVTNFQFSIANCQLTILKVYDVLGREVATLVNEVKQPGEYTAIWDAANVPSGIYFYRLIAGSYIETKKLLLLR